VVLTVAVGIAILSNGIRVAMVSVFAYYGIRGANGDVHGPYSLLRSLFVSGIGFISLFWLISWLGDSPEESPETRVVTKESNPYPRLLPTIVAIALLLGANALLMQRGAEAIPLRADLATFPNQLGRWRAVGVTPSTTRLGQLNFDATLSRTYSAGDAGELTLFIGYYGRQENERELADYRIRETVLGGVTSHSTTRLSENVGVNEFLTTAPRQTQYVTYWYILHGRIVAHDYEAKLRTALNSIFYRSSDGTLVVIRVPISPEETKESVRNRVRDFVEATINATEWYLPGSKS